MVQGVKTEEAQVSTSLIPGPVQWVKGSGVAAAAAQIQSLAGERPYATSTVIKKKKKKDSNYI